jgi:hypothetical protein
MNGKIFEEEFKAFTLEEQNELILYCKFFLKLKIKSANDKKDFNSVYFEIMRQLSEYENKLINIFKIRNLKYIKIENNKNYNYIRDKYPEVFI